MTDNGLIVKCTGCAKKNRIVEPDKRNVCGHCGAPLEIGGSVVELNGSGFDAFVESNGTAIVDFWADWCPPCRRMAPIFEEAAEKHTSVAFGKLDTQANQNVAARYRVESIPTLIFFRDGEEAGRLVGLSDHARIEQGIRSWFS